MVLFHIGHCWSIQLFGDRHLSLCWIWAGWSVASPLRVDIGFLVWQEHKWPFSLFVSWALSRISLGRARVAYINQLQ